MKGQFNLILCRTPKEQVEKGVPVMAKGSGVRVFDEQGKSYLDFVSGVTRPVHVGYGRKEIAQAVYDQICEIPYFTQMQFKNRPAMNLANVLGEIAPGKINKFFFVCDGSEAVESAIKFARHYHYYRGEKKLYKIISRRGAYHGVTTGALNVLGTVRSQNPLFLFDAESLPSASGDP